jgi:hypothetical protein
VVRLDRGEFAILWFEIDNKALYFPELEALRNSDKALYDSIYRCFEAAACRNRS